MEVEHESCSPWRLIAAMSGTTAASTSPDTAFVLEVVVVVTIAVLIVRARRAARAGAHARCDVVRAIFQAKCVADKWLRSRPPCPHLDCVLAPLPRARS